MKQKNIKLILGSKSPRRQKFIQELGFPFEVRTKEVEEIYPEDLEKKKVPEYLAKLKSEPLKSGIADNEILITSDTIVLLYGEVIGKPKSREHAIDTLKKLSNNSHTVISGVNLFNPKKEVSFSVETNVYFDKLSDEEITDYVDKFEPFDKAGSYAIQEWIGFIGVKKIEGCYYNIVGFPMNAIYQKIKSEFDNI